MGTRTQSGLHLETSNRIVAAGTVCDGATNILWRTPSKGDSSTSVERSLDAKSRSPRLKDSAVL